MTFEIPRSVNLTEITRENSAFLFGPRLTGKTFWIRESLGTDRYINLLKASERRRFIENPSILASYVAQFSPGAPIVIDEIQLVPELLDEIHDLIETSGHRFLLTGSSARKLKRSNANMLGGRAKKVEFFPLTFYELNRVKKFNLNQYLLIGGIPKVYLSEHPKEELSNYVDTYLDQEIKAEAVTRNIFGFENFLQKIALASGDVIVLQNIANDVQVSPPTIRQYLEVLEDTLIGFYLKPWNSPKRKSIQSAKFYLFDLGLKWFLSGVDSIPKASDLYGKAFEQFLISEIRAFHSYQRTREELCFWRTTHGDEVDLLVGQKEGIEIKAGEKVSLRDAKGLLKLRDEGFNGRLIVISNDILNRREEGVEFLHWQTYCERLWGSVN